MRGYTIQPLLQKILFFYLFSQYTLDNWKAQTNNIIVQITIKHHTLDKV